MRHFDLAPLYRATIGFEQITDLMTQVSESAAHQNSYPPFNIEKTSEEAYRISIAVAGFETDDLAIEVKENALIVTGRKSNDTNPGDYLHRGIASRAFERRFQLAEHVKVCKADHNNGMLHIMLMREIPDALRPRQIAIGQSTKGTLN